MNSPSRLGPGELVQLAVVVILAATLRLGYVHLATEDGAHAPALVVQGEGRKVAAPAGADMPLATPAAELDVLVRNLADGRGFETVAPLADLVEPTAHLAPGYAWLVGQMIQFGSPAWVRWLQGGLGAVTVVCLYLFVRRAFGSGLAGLIAGFLAALHPFWIANAAEINDGVVATFFLVLALMLGTRGSQAGGAFTSVLYGLSLAGLAMVRAAMLPFAVAGLLWFLIRCKHVRYGWFNAVLAFLGFANGLAPWTVRNWRLYDEVVPVATSAYLHLWIGNNPAADGGPLDETTVQQALPADRLKLLVNEPNQAKRYAALGQDVRHELQRDPGAAVRRRWQAGLKFLMGDAWFRDQRMSRERLPVDETSRSAASSWTPGSVEAWLQGSLLLLLTLTVLGWRWSGGCASSSRLASLALILVPLPYVLSHAEELSGPRLPWDALLICYAAYALASLLPSAGRRTEMETRSAGLGAT